MAPRVTGVSYAFVNTRAGVVAQVMEGDEVPDCDDAELARLDALGVFGDHPRKAWEAWLDEIGAQRRPDVERSEEELLARADRSGDDDDGGLGDLFPDPTVPPLAEDLRARTVPQLLTFARAREVDLGDARRKGEIVDRLAVVLADAQAEAENAGSEV